MEMEITGQRAHPNSTDSDKINPAYLL